MATRLDPANEGDRWLIERAGFGNTVANQSEYVVVTNMLTMETNWDFTRWLSGARTLPVAHRYIHEHFPELSSGDVVDVEFILKMKPTKKVSERFTRVAT